MVMKALKNNIVSPMKASKSVFKTENKLKPEPVFYVSLPMPDGCSLQPSASETLEMGFKNCQEISSMLEPNTQLFRVQPDKQNMRDKAIVEHPAACLNIRSPASENIQNETVTYPHQELINTLLSKDSVKDYLLKTVSGCGKQTKISFAGSVNPPLSSDVCIELTIEMNDGRAQFPAMLFPEQALKWMLEDFKMRGDAQQEIALLEQYMACVTDAKIQLTHAKVKLISPNMQHFTNQELIERLFSKDSVKAYIRAMVSVCDQQTKISVAVSANPPPISDVGIKFTIEMNGRTVQLLTRSFPEQALKWMLEDFRLRSDAHQDVDLQEVIALLDMYMTRITRARILHQGNELFDDLWAKKRPRLKPIIQDRLCIKGHKISRAKFIIPTDYQHTQDDQLCLNVVYGSKEDYLTADPAFFDACIKKLTGQAQTRMRECKDLLIGIREAEWLPDPSLQSHDGIHEQNARVGSHVA